jgi:hypothetical protein
LVKTPNYKSRILGNKNNKENVKLVKTKRVRRREEIVVAVNRDRVIIIIVIIIVIEFLTSQPQLGNIHLSCDM